MRKMLSLGIAFLMIGGGALIFANWLFLGGSLPKFTGAFATGLILGGVAIAFDDIRDWWSKS